MVSVALTAAWICAPDSAFAQHAGESAAAKAEDAFGGAVGQETVGIYTDTEVRGFNPQRAGNARIDDVYFDQLAMFIQRARASYAIKVGFGALGDPSPAPSGIVAYRAREPGDKLRSTAQISLRDYGGMIAEYDAEIPLIKDHLSLGAGISHGRPEFIDGSDARNVAFGLVPYARLGDLEIKPFISGFIQHDIDAKPLIISSGPFIPELVKPRRYLGQSWANNRSENYNGGVVVKAHLGDGLVFRGGAFQSRIDRKRNYTELFSVRDPSGLASHKLLADPRQNAYANSWEAFVAYKFGDEELSHTVHVDLRGRHRHIESGGSQLLDFGEVQLGTPDPEKKPRFAFTGLNLATLDQSNYSIGYKGALKGVGQINLGLTKSDYSAEVNGPAIHSQSSAKPWLYNASVVVQPTRRLALYAAYVSGLEDNGAAPESAVNRNQQLPSSQTSQIDAGLRWAVGDMRIVASVFEMKRPNFSYDAAGRYVELGDLSHRGLEVSATGHLGERLHVVAGAILMDPTVSGPAVDQDLLGPRPVGTPKLHARADFTYRTDIMGGLNLTLGVLHDSAKAASASEYAQLGGRQLFLPSHTTIDLGARQNFKIGDTPLSARLVVYNIFDQRTWKVISSNTFQLDDTRRWNLFLIADF